MAGRRKRVAGTTGETTVKGSERDETTRTSGYQQFRQQRIKENQERMLKLGIVDLSLKLKSQVASGKRISRKPSETKPINQPTGSHSPRRSSRLKSLVPVSYIEIRPKRKRESLEDGEITIREGSQPEIYTEEHVILLGDCKTSWTLFVDGHGEDGKRIYDGVRGETCHQCRQKTLGQHTHCSKCKLVQGQFCGDCLYMRYGENVIEANQNPGWTCPACRGICNCSFCRQAKGWMPTGSLYRKVIRQGYKSVAHFLIQSRRTPKNSENSGAEVPAERPMPMEESFLHDESHKIVMDPDGSSTSQPQDLMEDDMEGEMEKMQLIDNDHVNSNGAVDKDVCDTISNEDMLKEKKEDMAEQEMKGDLGGQDVHTQ
ncbi:hypothetical protein FNV43_RR22766 [Rhamnella rubrinervis]|uniref:Zinc-finger domain-containing protein n=1 Tax=Rhamnella rubrinervis TaxID=2594499 RepID=A0A8K0DXQ1_9ROSA|nr:hypothetical protein FNV43_RR22766 [Rhamnella rubrinervis]